MAAEQPLELEVSRYRGVLASFVDEKWRSLILSYAVFRSLFPYMALTRDKDGAGGGIDLAWVLLISLVLLVLGTAIFVAFLFFPGVRSLVLNNRDLGYTLFVIAVPVLGFGIPLYIQVRKQRDKEFRVYSKGIEVEESDGKREIYRSDIQEISEEEILGTYKVTIKTREKKHELKYLKNPARGRILQRMGFNG